MFLLANFQCPIQGHFTLLHAGVPSHCRAAVYVKLLLLTVGVTTVPGFCLNEASLGLHYTLCTCSTIEARGGVLKMLQESTLHHHIAPVCHASVAMSRVIVYANMLIFLQT